MGRIGVLSEKMSALASALCSVRAWGLALNRAWIYLMFLGIGASLLSLEGTPLPQEVYLSSTVALCFILVCGVVLRRYMERWLMMPHARWVAVGLTSLGTLFALLLPQSHFPTAVLCVLGGVATGLGSGLLDLCYGEVYRNVAPAEARIETPLSALLAATIYTLVIGAPIPMAILLTAMLPLFSGVMLSVQKGVWEHSGTRSLEYAPAPSKRLIARVGLCAAGVGIADSVNRHLFFVESSMAMSDFYQSGMLPSAVVSAVVLVGFAMLMRENKVSSLYKFVCFLVVGSIIMTPPLVMSSSLVWASIAILVGYNTFNVFIWVLLSDLTYNLRLSATATFGVGWGMLTVGHVVGQLLATGIVTAAGVPLTALTATAFCGILALAACLFVLQDDDFAEVADMPAMVRQVAHQVETSIDQEAAEPEDAQDEPAVEVTPTKAQVADGAEVPAPGGFQSRCLDLAQGCGLTPRETEILILFARGRTSARIQEELYLSKGTVTTHLQHIYQKAGVHSRQELLDLLE